MDRNLDILIAQLIALMPEEEIPFKNDIRKLIAIANISERENYSHERIIYELETLVNNYLPFYFETEWIIELLMKFGNYSREQTDDFLLSYKESLEKRRVH